jgi:hypothetical protein
MAGRNSKATPANPKFAGFPNYPKEIEDATPLMGDCVAQTSVNVGKALDFLALCMIGEGDEPLLNGKGGLYILLYACEHALRKQVQYMDNCEKAEVMR